MNWKEIKEKYLKAHMVFIDWAVTGNKYTDTDICYLEALEDYKEPDDFNLRDLFDFFDKQGLHINVMINCTRWFYTVDIETGVTSASILFQSKKFNYKTRPEAELDAFKKSFELLETKLNEMNVNPKNK